MDDRYTSQAPDWNSWVTGGNYHPPEETVDPLAVQAEKRRLAQEALLSAQPNASAPGPENPNAPFQGLQEGQVIQPAPDGWKPQVASDAAVSPPQPAPAAPPPPALAPQEAPLPVPPIPPDQQSPVAAALGGPTAAPAATPAPTPAGPVSEALAAPPGPSTTLPPPVGNPGAPALVTKPSSEAAAPAAPTKASADRLAAFQAPYQKGQGYYDLVHPGEGNGTNPITGAAGPVQVIPATANAFHASPGNADVDLRTEAGAKRFTQWYGDQNSSLIQSITGRPATNGEVAAAHLVGPGGIKALLTNPNAPIGQTLGMAAVKNNPGPLPDPNMTGTQALASIQNYYAGAKGGGDTVTASSTSTPLAPVQDVRPGASDRQSQMNSILNGAKLYSPDELRGGPGDGLLAFAGGLLSGKSPSDAFGKGFTALAAHNQTDRANMMKSNALQAQLASLGIRGQAATETAAHHVATEGQGDRRLSQADQKIADAEAVTRWQQGPGKLEHDLAVAQGRSLTTDTVKENAKHAEQIDQAGEAANKNLPAMQGLLSQIDQSGAGPGVVSAFKRRVATALNMPIGDTDPSAIALTNAYASMGQSQAAQAMKGLGLRTQNEFNTFIKGVGTIDNDPTVVKTLIGQVMGRAQSDAQMYADYHALPTEEKSKLLTTPSGISDFRSKYVQANGAANGVRTNGQGAPAQAAAPSAPAAGPAGTVNMMGPDGKLYHIPAANAAAAAAKGFTAQ